MSDEHDNVNDEELDVCGKVKYLLEARNKVICNKPIQLDQANVADLELLDILDEEDISQVRPNKTFENREKDFQKIINEIRELKQTSESQMSFNVDESDVHDEVNKVMFDLQHLSSKLFKKIIGVQKEFNEHLNNKLVEYPENKSHIKNHTGLVEDICKFDKGIDAVIDFNEQKLKNSVQKDLKVESVEDFEKVCYEIAGGILRTVYEDGAKKYKNHNHLSAILQYNKPIVEEDMSVQSQNLQPVGRLDPFTQQPILKPVNNKVCGHTYDYDSVSQMFQNKLFISCPCVGCTNKHFTKKDIIFDLNTSSNSNE